MKEIICTIAGVVGSFIAGLFGGWDTSLVTLLLFMGIDYITGLAVAACGKSPKSDTGRLSSKIGWRQKVCISAAGSGGGASGYYPWHIVHPGRGVHCICRKRVAVDHRECRAAGRTAADSYYESNRTVTIERKR